MEHEIVRTEAAHTRRALTLIAVVSAVSGLLAAALRGIVAPATHGYLDPFMGLLGAVAILSLLVTLFSLSTRLQVEADDVEIEGALEGR